MPKVSVIVPVYNVATYLPKCVESIQNQTERDIEILLVDDGSTDDSGAICDAYAQKDARIKVFHQENGGLSAARNTGIKAATADLLVFIDSDDYVDADLIEVAYKKSVETGADIIAYGYQKVTPQGEISYTYQFPEELTKEATNIEQMPDLLLMTPSACNKMFRKSLFDKILFPERVWYEDLRTIPKLYPQANSICCIPRFFPYKYLTRDNSIMTSGNIEKTKNDRIAAVDSVLSFYKEANLYDNYQAQLNWLYFFHGYFLPCREIMNFSGETVPALRALKANLTEKVADFIPQNSPYFSTLTKREQLIFSLLYGERYTLLKLFVFVNQKFKK
ncbi:MAG: glycosyltransferase family 2 protein [Candidatus Fimenecus sp.]